MLMIKSYPYVTAKKLHPIIITQIKIYGNLNLALIALGQVIFSFVHLSSYYKFKASRTTWHHDS